MEAVKVYPLYTKGLTYAPKVLADIVESTIRVIYIDSKCSLDITGKAQEDDCTQQSFKSCVQRACQEIEIDFYTELFEQGAFDNDELKVGQQARSSSSSMEMDIVECKNYKHYIQSRTITLKDGYRRSQHVGCGIVLMIKETKNQVHCEKYGQALQQGEIQKHMKVFHEPLQ
ncbi:hypothetical protein U1Q18_004500 [Sarracenia purpurea var. burkii]